uniref:Putative ovule protein n=1 Tax=Solanum chacoense TaxID=4108 RepID=A0A0V0I9R4_SOLCH
MILGLFWCPKASVYIDCTLPYMGCILVIFTVYWTVHSIHPNSAPRAPVLIFGPVFAALNPYISVYRYIQCIYSCFGLFKPCNPTLLTLKYR